MEIWPADLINAPELLDEQVWDTSAIEGRPNRMISGIRRSRLDVFRPATPNGSAVLVMPGGSYARLAIDNEGHEVARHLADHGYSAFVLTYRLPCDGWAEGADVALCDAQRAIRVIRHHAAALNLPMKKLCALGFSAGGHLCAELMIQNEAVYSPVDAADGFSAKPDLAALIYPATTMQTPYRHDGVRNNLLGPNANAACEIARSPYLHVQPDNPPTFIVHAEDDPSVPVENALLLRSSLRSVGVNCETHLFPEGGHGFGIGFAPGRSVEPWPKLLVGWLSRQCA